MTMTQKILAAHAGLPFSQCCDSLLRQDLIWFPGNDITSPVA
ncbi:MAG: hypothetical protein ACLVCH_12390 [Roseburia inulinivorans]